MFMTTYGNFDGDTWEIICQKCLKIKYDDDGYQSVPAQFRGDLGIEGFTRTGKVFQCYCPDDNYNPDKLYEHQRDKITRDLKKLINYKDELRDLLGNIKIKQWIFLTPQYTHRKLLSHCTKKRTEYQNKKEPHLDGNFDIILKDIEHLFPQMTIVSKMMDNKIQINVRDVTDSEVQKWEDANIKEAQNLIRKIKSTFPQNISIQNKGLSKVVTNYVNSYLKGVRESKKLEETFQEEYEKLVKLIDFYEMEIHEECLYPHKDNKAFFEDIKNKLLIKLQNEFKILDPILINELKRYIIADWLMRCPLDFGSMG